MWYVTCNAHGVVMSKATKKQERPSGTAARVRKHREKMKAAGLKPVTIWLPDWDSPEMKEQIARDIATINASADEKVILEELSNIEIEGWK